MADRRALLIAGAHLAVLWAFAFAQPLLDLLGDNPDFFVARGNGRADILVLAFGLVLAPPALMLAAEALVARFRPDLARGLHLALVGLLAAAFALQAIKDLVSHPAGLMIMAALAVGAGVAYAYARTTFVPSALSFLSPAPILFLFLFLIVSPVHKLVLPQSSGDEAVDVPGGTPVVVLLFDEFPGTSLMDPSGRIDASRFPHFAELAARSTWYRNATTVADKTPRAIPAIVAGSEPDPDALPIVSDHPQNLFTLLGERYDMDVTETATDLCPERLCGAQEQRGSFGSRINDLVSDLSVVSEHLLLPDAIRAHLPAVDQTFAGFRGGGLDKPGARKGAATPRGNAVRESRPKQFQRFLRGIDGRRSSLDFLHIQLPHFPWQYLPTGQQYPVDAPTDREAMRSSVGEDRWVDDELIVEHALQRHLLQVGDSDRLIGKLIARLKAQGIWDRALLVVTPDHGIAFQAGGSRRDVTAENIVEISSIPLFIKAPGQRRGRVEEDHVVTTDILPTIAELLGIELPEDPDGESAMSDAEPEPEVSVLNRLTGTTSVSYEEWVRRRDAVVAREADMFPPDRGFGPVFELGPHKELIGASVAGLSVRPDSSSHVVFDGERPFVGVDPQATFVPSLVSGTMSGQAKAGDDIALAVNGRIAAVGRLHQVVGQRRFQVMVPPPAFRRGDNLVQLMRVRDGGNTLLLVEGPGVGG
jgi:sulfatase-like protein